MNKTELTRQESALTIEELLDENISLPTQNWLLTYVDVFVLIVMLVVTLISLSSFEQTQPAKTFQKQSSAPHKAQQTETAPKPVASSQAFTFQEAPVIKKLEAFDINEQLTPDFNHTPINLAETNQAPATDEIIIAESDNLSEPDILTDKPAAVPQTETEKTNLKEQLNKELETLGLNDSINMTVSKGYAQLKIQDNILYQSSEAELSESGKSVLKRLTPLLKQSKGLIYIEGHTDNRPIKTSRFPSNWELGAARAASVLHFLASQQIEPARMRAVTYADTKPIADNNTEQGRQKNRRVNIVIKVSDKTD